MFFNLRFWIAHVFVFTCSLHAQAQHNLLLNGNFEDINICSEYHSECGVEAWFYMSATHVNLAKSETGNPILGNNTLTIYYDWIRINPFTPVIGTILPCQLQKGHHYHFKGLFNARSNARLNFKLGVALGEYFYVPRKPFTENIKLDSITEIAELPNSNLFTFNYDFIANGTEKYLTIGNFITEDTLNGKHITMGQDEISLTVDNFELISNDPNEVVCSDYEINKLAIYNYNFRHKTMDYALYAKGELPIKFAGNDSGFTTKEIIPPINKFAKSDTVRLGDVLFDFNKAQLKQTALQLLQNVFTQKELKSIDSIFVEGYTDSIGSEIQNIQLAFQRSQNVKNWLIKENIIPEKNITIHAFGKSRPIATNTTPQGRSLNRRVELIIFRKKDK